MRRGYNIRRLRRTIGIVIDEEWSQLSRDEKDAANALTLHIHTRTYARRHPAFDGDETFLTNGHVQRLLKAAKAKNTGEKAARNALTIMQRRGWLVDTGRVKKPKRSPASLERAGTFCPGAETPATGGRDAQPQLQRSYWWRVFRVPALTAVLKASRPQGAYATFLIEPHYEASLLAFLRRQGVITKSKRRSRPNPGSVQWAFAHSGPP